MRLLAGAADIVIGVVYLLLGGASLVESAGRQRCAHRGLGLALTALACAGGSRAVLAGVDVLVGRGPSSVPLVSATLLGLLPATVFCWLRYEAYLGGPGDRILHGSPGSVSLLPPGFAFAAGAILVLSWVDRPGGPNPALTIAGVPPALIAAAFVGLGWHLLRAQQVRHGVAGCWSLSGLAVTLLFPTWAVTYASQVMVADTAPVIRLLDWLTVPAAGWLLVECRRLVAVAARSSSRASLVVSPQRAGRPAPWAATGDGRQANGGR